MTIEEVLQHDLKFRENEKPEWLTMEQIKEYSNAMEVTQE